MKAILEGDRKQKPIRTLQVSDHLLVELLKVMKHTDRAQLVQCTKNPLPADSKPVGIEYHDGTFFLQIESSEFTGDDYLTPWLTAYMPCRSLSRTVAIDSPEDPRLPRPGEYDGLGIVESVKVSDDGAIATILYKQSE